ncbi:MAG: cation diffusion facilitator family transporter [Bacteriovoracaceae bacterium]|nr:cation diffusion facilitator family transporter [Bacteriovoracaceae bacterium]
MSHDHSHNQSLKGDKDILLAFSLNAIFSVIELVGGYLTNSVAIYSDALHDFGDSLALLFSYFAEKLSNKEEDSKFTFGYRRFSMLSALINGLILLSGSVFVMYEAFQRLGSPEPVKPEGMLGLAILGIIVNSFAAYRLSKGSSLNTKMIMYHLLEDLLGWVAVLVVSIILLFKPWYILDSVLSIVISIVILRGVYKNLKKVGLIFLQKFPEELDLSRIKKEIRSFDLVNDIHAAKGWSIDSETFYLRFHVKVPQDTIMKEVDALKDEVKGILDSHNVKYSTIEFESSACNEGDS